MESVSSRKVEKGENKKRKFAVLANIDQSIEQRTSKVKAAFSKEGDNVGFLNVPHNKLNLKMAPKNSKTLSSTLASDYSDPKKKIAKIECGTNDDDSESSNSIPSNLNGTAQLTEDVNGAPNLMLQGLGKRAFLKNPQDGRTPIFLTDIQHLLMTALIGEKPPCLPDHWCLLQESSSLSHSVVLIVQGMSLDHYLSNETKFEATNKIFETKLEVVLPPRDAGLLTEMAQVPLTHIQVEELIQKYGSLETAAAMNKDPTILVKNMFPIDTLSKTEKTKKTSLPTTDKFPRTKLLLSALQMVEEGYPMPLGGDLQNHFSNYIFTKEKYDPVTDHSPMFGVDCEMCRTSVDINELTRVSIVNEKMETVYESLVRPNNKIIDYLTPFSGITPEIMKTVTKDISVVQQEVQALLPADAILVGHSLLFDLHALRMMHPYIIDTSVCFNISGVRVRKSRLQHLAMTFLKETIQENIDGHDSVEDSAASLKLVQLKLENNLEFGDEVLLQKYQLQKTLRTAKSFANNLIVHASQQKKKTAIINAGVLEQSIKDMIPKTAEANASIDNMPETIDIFELDSNKKAIKKACEVALEHALTITNLQLNDEHTRLEAMENTVAKIDKWIAKIWKTIAPNGLFLVLMTGSANCSSGVTKIAIKNNV